MGFFTEFDGWLRALLATYIDENTRAIAQALEPLVVTLATLYVMVWGYLQMTGRIEEPLTTGIKRLIGLALIFAIVIHLWLYNAVIVAGFFDAPRELAAVIVGAYDPVEIVDRISFAGNDVANLLFRKADIWTPSYAPAGIVVALIMGFVTIYTIFLLSLSRIALSLLLAIGPLFITLLMFETTKRFFEAWLSQLVHYALIAVLTVLVAALMMTLVETAAQSALDAGDGIQIAHATRMCMAAGLALLVMRQVNAIASGLAGGIALATGGVVSGLTRWALGQPLRGAGLFTRGTLLHRYRLRENSLSRRAGHRAGAINPTAVLGQRRNSWRQA